MFCVLTFSFNILQNQFCCFDSNIKGTIRFKFGRNPCLYRCNGILYLWNLVVREMKWIRSCNTAWQKIADLSMHNLPVCDGLLVGWGVARLGSEEIC